MAFVKWESVPHVVGGELGPWIIYGLIDPRDETVRYVGFTSGWPKDRLRSHIAKPTNRSTRAWFMELSALGLAPDVRAIALPVTAWQDSERGWIAWFRERGDLLNVDPGGICRDKAGKLFVTKKRPRKRKTSKATKRAERRAWGEYLKSRVSAKTAPAPYAGPTIRRRST